MNKNHDQYVFDHPYVMPDLKFNIDFLRQGTVAGITRYVQSETVSLELDYRSYFNWKPM